MSGSGDRAPFDLQLVEPFVVLAEESLRFPAAAARLGVGTSALSRQIARLQRELGATLVGVEGRIHVLTPAGQRFLVHARVMHERLVALRSQGVHAVASSLRIQLGHAATPAIELMITDFIRENRGVEVDVAAHRRLSSSSLMRRRWGW